MLCSHFKLDSEFIPNNERECGVPTYASAVEGIDVIPICEFRAGVGLLTLTMGFELFFTNQLPQLK